MSDLPESLQRAHAAAMVQAFLDDPFQVKPEASPDQEALRAQQYLAAQAFHIRQALESIARALHDKKR